LIETVKCGIEVVKKDKKKRIEEVIDTQREFFLEFTLKI